MALVDRGLTSVRSVTIKIHLQIIRRPPHTAEEGGFVHYAEKVEGRIIQARSESFKDHFSQARLFWNSMSPPEKQHITDAFIFEVGKVTSKSVRQQVVDMFVHVDKGLAIHVADGVGVNRPTGEQVNVKASSPALSQAKYDESPLHVESWRADWQWI